MAMKECTDSLGFLLAPLYAETEVRARNLLNNPDFDVDITGWDISGTCFAPAWDAFGPGFANGALAINCVSPSMVGKVRQCFHIYPTDIDFAAELTDNGSPGPVAFGLLGYATADCTGAATILLDSTGSSVVPSGGCCGTAWNTNFTREHVVACTHA